MWYEEENEFIRAPTPKGLDTLVQHLENRDSVIFESISLPRVRNQPRPPTPFSEENNSTIDDFPSPPKALSPASSFEEDISLDLGLTDTNSFNCSQDEITQLRNRVSSLEYSLKEKDSQLNMKEEEIRELRLALDLKNRPKTVDNSTLYKAKYETTLNELTKLKEALAAEGKVKKIKIRSARVVSTKK